MTDMAPHIRAEQAANVERRIHAIEKLGQHGAMPDYWRKPLALAMAADEVAAADLHAEVAALVERLTAAERQLIAYRRFDREVAEIGPNTR